ncbi:phosphoprotein associated with glycosphingolipid-enriched microdomains 1 isoform X2 [Ambystoma mexicanum]|uniref:phosphoprotein associated with glycosphingolipid-enriched microdomains 1 isoform X2 n=1 Tax=Ambystoma mexicanum TaxID=8296 RepID=UPI0037E70BA5
MGPAAGFLNSGQAPVIALGGLAAVATFLLLTLLAFICSSCDREKKPKHQNGDHENLMNVPSDKETFSHSVTSLATDPPPSTYQNGGISNGDVISEDSTTACIEPYEEVQTSCPDLCEPQDSMGKSVKHPQSRELPSIPPRTNMEPILPASADLCLGTEGPYEVLKDSTSQENIIEDCLYETVNEMKESAVAVPTESSKNLGAAPIVQDLQSNDRSPECRFESAEYASVDRNRKSQQGVSAERAYIYSLDKEEEAPPPVPEKLLDENENVHGKDAEQNQDTQEESEGASRPSKRNSSLSYKSFKDEPSLEEDDIAAMYSSVQKPEDSIRIQDELANYAYIQDLATRRSPSVGSELYATVRDFEKSPHVFVGPDSALRAYEELDSADAEYEVVTSATTDGERTAPVPNDFNSSLPQGESDYESIGDLNQNGDVTRL